MRSWSYEEGCQSTTQSPFPSLSPKLMFVFGPVVWTDKAAYLVKLVPALLNTNSISPSIKNMLRYILLLYFLPVFFFLFIKYCAVSSGG